VLPAGEISIVPWSSTTRISFAGWLLITDCAQQCPPQVATIPPITTSKIFQKVLGNVFKQSLNIDFLYYFIMGIALQ
jgi:hypothetical protein